MNYHDNYEAGNAVVNDEAVGLNNALDNSEAGVESKIDAGIKNDAGSESYTEANLGVVSEIDDGIMSGSGSEVEAGNISGVESEIDAGIDINRNAGISSVLSPLVAGGTTTEPFSEPVVATRVNPNRRVMDDLDDVEDEPGPLVKVKKPFFSKRLKTIVAAVALTACLAFTAFNWAQKDITLMVDGKKIVTKTFASNVQDLINQRKIILSDTDRVTPDLDTRLKDGLQVTVLRSYPVSVAVDDQKLEVSSSAESVKQLIAEQKIALNELDEVVPSLEEKLSPGMEIKIARVEQKTVEKEVMVAYLTERRETPLLSRGVERVARPGVEGTERQVWQVTYRNGEEVDSQMLKSQMIASPVAEIVDRGTSQTTINGEHFVYSQNMYMEATAYTYTGSNTASGVAPHVGSVAVDPTVIPLGTKMYIEGYGYGKAEDTGLVIKGAKIDVFLETEQQCQNWGRKKVKVYILDTKGSGASTPAA